MNDLQKRTAQAIVNIFETGRVAGDYGAVTLLPGDAGHLTYGRSQTTLGSGNLFLLIKAYCERADAGSLPAWCSISRSCIFRSRSALRVQRSARNGRSSLANPASARSQYALISRKRLPLPRVVWLRP